MQWNRAFHCEFDEKSIRLKQQHDQNGGKVIVKQILASEERNTSKRIALWELESGIRVWKLTILVKSFETEKL